MKRALVVLGAPLLMLSAACAGEVADDDDDIAVADQAIIGGEPSRHGAYGATGALLGHHDGELYPFCTGTLIAPDTVVTAAHCMLPEAGMVGLPAFTLDDDANSVSPDDAVQGVESRVHPQFEASRLEHGRLQTSYDVAILRLERPVHGAPVAALPDSSEVQNLRPGMELEIAGYGLTDTSSRDAGVKYQASTPLVRLGETEMQVGRAGDPQDCNGDSGGPALADLGDGLRLVGLVSRGLKGGETSCDKGGIDTRVDVYLDWITER